MIAAEHFVFLHLHKSGGSFVIDCLQRFVPGVRELGYHLPGSLIPPTLTDRPVIGLVRNPWSYYVSWWSFQRQRPQQNALYRLLSDDGQLGFAGTISRMLDLGHDDALLDRLLTQLPVDYGGRGLNLPGHALAPIRGSGLGFYAFLYRHLYAGVRGTLHLGRVEDLPESLLGLFLAVGQPVSPGLREHLAAAPRLNTSQHEHWSTYYDEGLRERVARQDAEVIARHDYRFET